MSILEFHPVYGNADAYIMCLNLFSQIKHPNLVQYGCTFKDNLILIGCLNNEEITAPTADDLKDLVIQLVKVFSFLTGSNIKPFYASLRMNGNSLFVENWFYSLIQQNVDSLPNVKTEYLLNRLTNEILNTCNVKLTDVPSDTPLYHALQTLTNNKNIKDALKQASVILEDSHMVPNIPNDPFFAPLSEFHFLRWAMQFGNLKKNRQPNLFSIEPSYVSVDKEWSIPSGKPPLSLMKFDILSNFEQYKSSQAYIDGCNILSSLHDYKGILISNWVRPDVYRFLFNTPSDCQSLYLSNLKIIDQETSSQIALDVPRCHAYHPVLSSQSGKLMLKRILETWCFEYSDLEYWQGIDSIAATFLSIFLFDEAVAYHCFSTFIKTRLSGLFAKGNSQFPQLLKQCEIAVSEQIPRLKELDLQPDVITVPWFLTAFSRTFLTNVDVLPFRQVYIVWDALIFKCKDQASTIDFLTKVGISIVQQGLLNVPEGTSIDDGISLVDKLYDIRDADLQKIVLQIQ